MTALPWLFALAAFVALDGRMLAPVLPAIAGSLRASPGAVGLSITAYTAAYGVCQLAYGPLSDRYGRVRVIRLAALLFAAGTAASSLAGSLWGFVGARLVTGMFAAAAIPTTFAYIGDTVRYERRLVVIGRFGAAISGAEALSVALAGFVTHFVSWRVMYAAYAVLTLVPAAALVRAREEPHAAAVSEPLSYARILGLRRARHLYGAIFVEGFLVWGVSTYLGVLASQRFGFNDLQVGLLLACYGTGRISGALWLSRLAPALGERALASIGGWIEGAAFTLLLFDLPWPLFALSLLAFGLGLALLHSTLQTRGTEIAPAARGKAFALFALGYFGGGAVGAAVFGRLVDMGLILVVLACCGVGLTALGQLVARAETR